MTLRSQWPVLACALSGDLAAVAKASAGELLFELNSQLPIAESGDAVAPRQNWFKLEAALAGGLWRDNISWFTTLVMEPMAIGNTHLFGEEGLFLEEAGVVVELDAASLLLGKFNPPFGLAWEDHWGIFNDDFTDDYELTEQVGAAVQWRTRFGSGEQQFFVGVFTDDRSLFSDSSITSRGRNRTGEAAGLDQLQSLSLTLQGSFPAAAGELGYHLGYRRLAVPGESEPEQRGAVGSLSYQRQVFTGILASLRMEWAGFENFYEPGDRVRFVTPALVLQKERLELSLSRSQQNIDGSRLVQFNLRYALPGDKSLSLGWKRESDEAGSFQQVGVRFETQLAF